MSENLTSTNGLFLDEVIIKVASPKVADALVGVPGFVASPFVLFDVETHLNFLVQKIQIVFLLFEILQMF